MEKRFCDICEKPAWKEADRVEVVRSIGEEYNPLPNKYEPQVKQCKVVVRAVITFRDHPTGFGGPPDLCRKCLCGLLNTLRASLEEGPGMATSIKAG